MSFIIRILHLSLVESHAGTSVTVSVKSPYLDDSNVYEKTVAFYDDIEEFWMVDWFEKTVSEISESDPPPPYELFASCVLAEKVISRLFYGLSIDDDDMKDIELVHFNNIHRHEVEPFFSGQS